MPVRPEVAGQFNAVPNLPLITPELRKILAKEEVYTDDEGGSCRRSRAHRLAQRLYDMSGVNDRRTALSAIAIILDRIDGRVKDSAITDPSEIISSADAQEQIKQIMEASPRMRRMIQETLDKAKVVKNERIEEIVDRTKKKDP